LFGKAWEHAVAEVSNGLIYEVLKKVQEQVTRVQTGVHGIREELSAIRGHMNAVQRDIHVTYDWFDGLDRRMDRIEQRLELTDARS